MLFSRNISILLILRAVRWFLVVMPIITIFYQRHGLSMQEIFLIQSVFSIWVVLFEVPTGYFADVIGRKQSLIIGMLFAIIGLALYAFSHEFWWFLCAELILWLGSSFISGTDSAMIYDTLIDEGHEGKNKKIQWYLQSVSSISESLASLLGWFLAVISISLPFYVELGVFVMFFPLVFLLKEPNRHKHKNAEWILRWITKIVRYSLHEHKEIKWLIIFSWFFGSSTLVMTWLLQLYFTKVGVPLQYFWAIWMIFNLSIIPFSFLAHKIEWLLGWKYSLILLSLLPALWYFFLGFFQSIIGLIFVFFFYIARGFGSVILNDYVNTLISSDIRATVLSVQALAFRWVFSVIGPIIGWITDATSMRISLFVAGFIFLMSTLSSLFFLWKNKSF